MERIFVGRNLFTKSNGEMKATQITIDQPRLNGDGLFECKVKFSNVKKYNTSAKCFDEICALECALDYVEGICKNSEDPEFFISIDESMKGFNRK